MRLTASELGLPLWSVLGCFLPSLAPVTEEGGREGLLVSGRDGLGFRVSGFGFRVSGLGFRGLGFRV